MWISTDGGDQKAIRASNAIMVAKSARAASTLRAAQIVAPSRKKYDTHQATATFLSPGKKCAGRERAALARTSVPTNEISEASFFTQSHTATSPLLTATEKRQRTSHKNKERDTKKKKKKRKKGEREREKGRERVEKRKERERERYKKEKKSYERVKRKYMEKKRDTRQEKEKEKERERERERGGKRENSLDVTHW